MTMANHWCPILLALLLLPNHAAAQRQRTNNNSSGNNNLRGGGAGGPSSAPTVRPSVPPTASPALKIESALPLINGDGVVVDFADPSDGQRSSVTPSDRTEDVRSVSTSKDCHDGQLFQLDLRTDYNGCETSWTLERIITTGYGDTSSLYVDGYVADYFDASHASSETICLLEGNYRYTIFDAFGDGIEAPGYYMLALDGTVLAGSSNFGYEESTYFTVVTPPPETIIMEESVIENEDLDLVVGASSSLSISSSSFSNDQAAEVEDLRVKETSVPIPEWLAGIIDLSIASDVHVLESDRPTLKPTAQPATASASGEQAESIVQALNNQDADDTDKSTEGADEPQPHPIKQQYSHDPTKNHVAQDEPASDADAPPPASSWTELLNEDFEDDLGVFHASQSEYITYYPYVKERHGVVRLQNENNHRQKGGAAHIYSDSLSIVDPLSSPSSSSPSPSSSSSSSSSEDTIHLQLLFSYYASSMEIHDGFCFDYSMDDGTSWHSERCWHAVQDFENGMWYDDVGVSFSLNKDHTRIVEKDNQGKLDAFRIRFRCRADSRKDDVLIDKVQLLGLRDGGAELKDSI